MKKRLGFYCFSGNCVLIIFCLLGVYLSGCREKENPIIPSIDIDLIGRWDINTLETKFNGTKEVLTKTDLDSSGTVWMYTFNSDNTMEQITDSDSTLITIYGTWITGGNELIMRLILSNGKEGVFSYYYNVNGNNMSLSWDEHTGMAYKAGFVER